MFVQHPLRQLQGVRRLRAEFLRLGHGDTPPGSRRSMIFCQMASAGLIQILVLSDGGCLGSPRRARPAHRSQERFSAPA
jgi:hypothetical protein